METLKLYWLGHPLVELEGRTVKLETRKAAALLSYLSLTPGSCQRELLATMFWPEGSQYKAHANFRRTLSSLNASLPGWIEADRESVALMQNDNLWVDVEVFHQFLSQLKEHNHSGKGICDRCLAILEKMVETYRGEFLEGLNLNDCPTFDDWQFFQRDSLSQELADALQRLSAGYAERGQQAQAIACARRWVAMDRLHEPAHRALINLYANSGQRTAALRQFEEFTRLMKEELGQEPEQETQRLYEQIRGRVDAKQVVEVPENQTPFPLLKTKLYIPAAPASRVARARLIGRLSEAKSKALSIISAPAGFGKTTLLAEWIAQTTLPVAWVSLDTGDNDPYRFLAYLISALESIHEDVGDEALQLMRSQQLVPAHIILASLINDLGKINSSYMLVLDDYQFISEHSVHESVAYLLDHLPVNMHVVIATRADPPLQLGRLRAYGQMMEVRTQDLRFTSEEATEFLNEVMRLRLSMEDIESLETRTEGWVVGLKMAALSLRGHENASEFIQAFSGSHRYVLDYLLEEVLKREPAHIQTFLLHTSVLEKLSGPLCDAVMSDEWRRSGESGQTILEYLEKSNLFVVPLDEHKQWYRYHHLFADLLRAQLLKFLEHQAGAQLHLRASKWYEQNGSPLEAIYHASLAFDFERIERLIDQNYLEMLNRGEMYWLRSWTGKLSKELLYKRPWLCIYEAQSHAWFGELDEAHRLLEEAEKRIQILAPEGQAMLGHLAYVRSRVTAMRGDLQRAIELCLAAHELIPASNLGLQLDIRMTLAYEYFLNGDYSNAEPSLREIIRSSATISSVINSVAAYCVMARLYAVQGMLKKSDVLYQTAAQLIPQASGQHLGAKAMVEVGIADLLCERNNLEEALVHVQQGLALLPWWGKTDDFVLAYITLARIYLAQGKNKDATEAVEKATQLIQTRGVFSEARNAVEVAQVKLWLVQEDLIAVDRWAASIEKHFDPNVPYPFENELIHITQARAFISQKNFDEAVRLLSGLEEIAQSCGRVGRLIEIIILKALAIQTGGDSRQAVLTLGKSLALAQPEDYMRIFLDEGKPMIQLLKKSRDSELDSHLKDYIDRLLDASTQNQN